MGDLSHEEQKVGIVFGFMKQILTFSKRFNSAKLVFCWDSKKSFRKKIYPEYKKRNPFTEEEIVFEKFALKQFIELRTYTLPKFGFKNIFIQTGLEADDIIAAIAHNYNREFVIVSGDEDLYQLLKNNISMYSPKKKKIFTEHDFTKQYGITPKEWVMVKRIAGCRSDKVIGIDGIGEKRAIQYLKGTLGKNTKGYQNILDGQHIIERNKTLVELPFEGTKIPKLMDKETFSINNFIDLTDKYGFRSFQQISTMNEWVNQFNMK